MPGDRVITLTVRAPGKRNVHGEYIPGPITFQGPVWAERRDLTLTDIEEEGGETTNTTREWRIRYRADVLQAATRHLDDVSVTEDGLLFDLQQIIEDPGARRFEGLLINGIRNPGSPPTTAKE